MEQKPYLLNTSKKVPQDQQEKAWKILIQYTAQFSNRFEIQSRKAEIQPLLQFGTFQGQKLIGQITPQFLQALTKNSCREKLRWLHLYQDSLLIFEHYDFGADVTAHLTPKQFKNLKVRLKKQGLNPQIVNWRLS